MPGLTPRYTRANVLTGQAAVWYAPYNATTPVPLPGKALALGGDWANGTTGNAAWQFLGATEAGVTVRFARETTDITIEEQVNPVDVAVNTLDARIETTLSEGSLEAMKLAYGGGTITVVAPSTGIPGVRELVINQDLEHLHLGMESVNPKGQWRRIYFEDVLSVAEVETSYRRAESQQLYSVSFRLVSPISSLKVMDWNLAAT